MLNRSRVHLRPSLYNLGPGQARPTESHREASNPTRLGYDRLYTVKQRRGNQAVYPDWALGFIPVTEGLIEQARIDLKIVIQKELEHGYRHRELSIASLGQEAVHFAFERYPVVAA